MKFNYSEKFNKDYAFYLSIKDDFNFDGTLDYTDKNNNNRILYDINGYSAKEAFFAYDTYGKTIKCREVELLKSIIKAKGSINFNIKQWVEGFKDYSFLSSYENFFNMEYIKWNQDGSFINTTLNKQYNFPEWVNKAFINQYIKYNGKSTKTC